MSDHEKKSLPERLADMLQENGDRAALASLLRHEKVDEVAVALDKLDEDQGDRVLRAMEEDRAGEVLTQLAPDRARKIIRRLDLPPRRVVTAAVL